MDTDEFLKRCEDIEKGLHELADELYAALDQGVVQAQLADVVKRSREKVRSYDEFVTMLEDDDEREEADDVLGRNIGRLRKNIERAEASG